MRRAADLVGLVALAGLLAVGAAGCEDYAETVECGMGTVLNEDDECVPPPPPDGGVAIADCTELCEAVSGWDASQIECLTSMVGRFGSPPDACLGDLTDVATCNACVSAAGATPDLCATAGSLCQ